MAKRNKVALSNGFDTTRLDAIGPWTEKTVDDDILEIQWAAPPALAGLWLPLGLRFRTGRGGTTFDPDDRMFALWELFLSDKKKFAAQRRKRTSKYGGGIEWADLVASRIGEPPIHELSLLLTFELDEEHNYLSYFDESKLAFGEVIC